jgi:uncharacterized RDD family membrane protein YckC
MSAGFNSANTMNNPYQAPVADLSLPATHELEYVGFWPRVGASLIDTIILMCITYPLLYTVYGVEFFSKESLLPAPVEILINYVLPAILVTVLWIYKSATPGKMVIGATIVDAKTGGKPSTGQCIGRYLAYYLSLLPLGLGYFWVAWDSKKQAWHDKLAGTVVVRTKRGDSVPVTFTSSN